jgi:hypothetical protein
MADKKRGILEFVEQSNFEQFTPTHLFLTNLISIMCFDVLDDDAASFPLKYQHKLIKLIK